MLLLLTHVAPTVALAQALSPDARALETGNPVSMPWRDKVKAIVQACYPGQAGGQVNPSGRRPITFPADLAQTPRPELPGLGTPWGTPTTLRRMKFPRASMRPDHRAVPLAQVPLRGKGCGANAKGSTSPRRCFA